MPLDTGEIGDLQGPHDRGENGVADHLAGLRPVRLVLRQGGHVGEALGAARRQLGLAEDDIAQVTRVRAAYIGAIEAFDFAALPARPFVVGYVRAYAQALGLDSEAVVARFHAEAPKVDGKLRAPGGVRDDGLRSLRWLIAVGAVVATAIGAWNLTRRVELQPNAPPPPLASRPALARPLGEPAHIGAPLPTPPEATTPPVYQTPGLGGPVQPAPAAAAGATSFSQTAAPGATFAPAGTIYGARSGASGVVLQARASTSLVVRGDDGAIHFAAMLAPGEAWRAPATVGLTVDVGKPSAVEVFIGGTSRGVLSQAQTPLSKLAVP